MLTERVPMMVARFQLQTVATQVVEFARCARRGLSTCRGNA